MRGRPMQGWLRVECDDLRTKRQLEAHLADCPHCTEYLAQLRVTIDTLGHVDVDELSDDEVDDLVELYRRWQAG